MLSDFSRGSSSLDFNWNWYDIRMWTVCVCTDINDFEIGCVSKVWQNMYAFLLKWKIRACNVERCDLFPSIFHDDAHIRAKESKNGEWETM